MGVMPELDGENVPVATAVYGQAPGADMIAAEGIPAELLEAKVIQSPSGDDLGYRASRTAADPVLAQDYYGGRAETYNDDMIPWVVEITVKSPLTGWWNRDAENRYGKAAGVDPQKGYQITVDLGAVVYAQPESERYYDRVLLRPYDDGEVKDDRGFMLPDATCYQAT